MPMPKRMPIGARWSLALRILFGRYNVIRQTQTRLLEEITLRNRNKEWYQNYDAGRYPFVEAEDEGVY